MGKQSTIAVIAALAGLILMGCDAPRPAAQDASTSGQSEALKSALLRFKANARAEDRAADAAKALSGNWSGSAERAQAGSYLEAGQDLTNAERSALADLCHQVAHRKVRVDHIRVDKGGPTPTFTCGLAVRGKIRIRVDANGDPHRAG